MSVVSVADSNRWCIRVRPRSAELDGHGRDMLADVRQLGLKHIAGVLSSKIYFLTGRLAVSDVERLAAELLCDPVAEAFECHPGFTHRTDREPAIEVHAKPGVMNPVAISAREAAGRFFDGRTPTDGVVEDVRTARRYEILGAAGANDLEQIATRVLANDCIETIYIRGFDRNDKLPEASAVAPESDSTVRHVELAGLTDEELLRLSREAHLFLSIEEMRAVRDHFAGLDRHPTDLELETLAQTWSEHCVHKTLKSEIDYEGDGFGTSGQVRAHFDNLLKDTIVYATKTLDRDWCLSVFEDNAGVIAFDDQCGIAVKVETHNHPSAIEPYGGSATGIGGCIRDIMGCGLGAKPIASTDVFCLAPPDYDSNRLPKDVLHPRRILKGVVRGVRDYGNRMGIPTINGAVYFDERYLANPLVFCGCVGLIPRDRIDKAAQTGDKIVVAGGRTGRDGIHGATFSSAELTDTHADEFSHAVQIGNAIEEKKVLDALLLARDHPDGCLYSAVTDCGAGGLSSAVGEMGQKLGAVVDLDDVPLKYSGLRYDEIWISEAQERMVFAVPPEKLDTLLSIFADEEVEATVLGTFSDDGVLKVRYNNQTVGELDMSFLHDGYPRTVRRARWTASGRTASGLQRLETTDQSDRLLEALGEINTASKEWVIRQYDHEVQGRSVIKPLVGPDAGPSDAAVIRPRYDRQGGVAIGCGLCPELTEADPYWMAICAVDEALRNVICVGADPEHVAILDNFCWGKCDTPEALGELVRTCRGASDAAIAYALPFISGKDSLNNEFTQDENDARRLGLPARMSIPGTLLITATGLVADVGRCVSMDLKEPGSALVLASAPVDRAGLSEARDMHLEVSRLVTSGQVRSAHDVSDGGLAVAVAEMCIASRLGATLTLDDGTFADSIFTTVQTTYVLEMSEADAKLSGLPIVGKATGSRRLMIDTGQEHILDLPIADMAGAWRAPLAFEGGR